MQLVWATILGFILFALVLGGLVLPGVVKIQEAAEVSKALLGGNKCQSGMTVYEYDYWLKAFFRISLVEKLSKDNPERKIAAKFCSEALSCSLGDENIQKALKKTETASCCYKLFDEDLKTLAEYNEIKEKVGVEKCKLIK